MAKYSRPLYEDGLRAFEWRGESYEVTVTGHIVIYDDPTAADEIADVVGSQAKHAKARHKNSCWHTFSAVALPSDKG